MVGANGSGRSTLAKLLAGLYAPAQGSVMWDEAGLATADPEQLWVTAGDAVAGHRPLATARWQVTARENVTLGQGDGDDRAVLCDAKAWGADRGPYSRWPDAERRSGGSRPRRS